MDMTFNAFAHHGVRNIQALDELGEPGFQVQAVVQDQVRLGRLADVPGGGLVAVDFGAGLGDGLDLQLVPGHVLRDVGQHGEGGQHHGLLIAWPLAGGGTPARGEGQAEENGDDGGSGRAKDPGSADYFGAPKQKFRHTEYSTRRRHSAATPAVMGPLGWRHGNSCPQFPGATAGALPFFRARLHHRGALRGRRGTLCRGRTAAATVAAAALPGPHRCRVLGQPAVLRRRGHPGRGRRPPRRLPRPARPGHQAVVHAHHDSRWRWWPC